MSTKPKCVLITYDEDGKQIETCTVPRDAVEHLRRNALVMPWSLDDFGGRLDDEFARKLGGASLLLLSSAQPALREHISVTRDEQPVHRRR